MVDPGSSTLISATVVDSGFISGDTLTVGTPGGLASSFSSGTLTLTGSASVATFQTALESVAFGFAANGDPTGGGSHTTRTLDWTVNDGAASSNTGTSTVDTVHTAPTVTAGASVAFVQGGAPVTLDSGLTVADPDSGGNLTSATVNVVGGVFATDGDTLLASTAGTAITATYTAATETLSLSGTDTLADYQQVLRSVAFKSTGATPGSRTIDWSINDGVSNSATVTSTASVHDQPVVTSGGTVTFLGGGPAVAADPGLMVSDVSSATLASAQVVIGGFISGDTLTVGTLGGLTSSFSSGTLTLTGSASLTTYQTALESVDYGFAANSDPTGGGSHAFRTLDWTVNDGTAISNTGTSTINTQHTGPTVVAGASVAFAQGGSAVTLNSGLTVTDTDSSGILTGATVAVAGGVFATDGDTLSAITAGTSITATYTAATETLSLSGTDTVADYQQVLRSVAFSSNGATAGSRTIHWSANDSIDPSGTVFSTVTVRDMPTISAGGTVTFTGGGSPVAADPGLTVSDISSSTLSSGTVTIGGFIPGDTLTVGNLGGLTAGFSSGTLTLTGSASLSTYQTALESVDYGFAAGGDPTGGGGHTTRTLSWSINDGTVGSNTGTSTIDTVHTAPTVTAGGTVTFTGGGAAVALDPGLGVSDPDSGGVLASATVTVAGAITGDTLNFTNSNPTTEGNIGVSSDSNGVLVLTSAGTTATLAQWQTALESVTYSVSPSNGDPTGGGGDTARAIDWSVSDGVANSGTATSTLHTVHVAPTVAASGTAPYVAGGSAAVLDSGLTVSDPDSGGSLIGAKVTISSGLTSGDTLNFTNQNGITESGFSNGTLSLTGTASLANYQTALESITYSSSSADPAVGNTDTTRTISWTVNDGAATSASATSSVRVDTPPSVTAIDTVQASSNSGGTEQFTVDFSEAVSGVTTSAFALAETGSVGGTLASVSGGGNTYTVTVTGVSGSGTLGLTLKSSGTGIIDAAGNGPTAGFTGGETYTIAPASGTPSTSAPAAATIGVGQPGSVGTVTIAETPLSGGETFTLNLHDTNGVLTANTGAIGGGGTITSSNGGTTLSINGTLSQVNADLTTLTDTDGITPSDTIVYTLSDSNGGVGTPVTTTVTVNSTPSISFTTSPFAISQGASSPLGGVSIAETGNTTTSGEMFTAIVSDGAGVLSANTGAAGGGGSITPSNGGETLTIAGTLIQVNADLGTLSDTDASAAQDTLTVNASDSFGNSAAQGTDQINVTSASANVFNAHVYLDSNGDGIQDGAETGLAGVTVNLLNGAGNPTGQSLTTDAGGNVSFTGLANGTYEIAVVPPVGDVVSQATNTFTNNALSGGQTANATEGVYAPATFSVHVYDDVNVDGVQDTGDTNLSGVTVNLLTGTGSPTGNSATTDANGNASFTGLAPGAYEVQVVTPAGDGVTQTTNILTPDTLASGGSTSATEGLYAAPALTEPTISLTDAEGQSTGNLWSELIANGVDPDPSSLSITAVGTGGTQGLVTLSTGSQSLTYLATGTDPSRPVDSFTYTLTDGSGGMVTGTVDVTVTGPNLPTTVASTPGSTTTATGSGQRLISQGPGQTLQGSTAGGDEMFGGGDTTIQGFGSGNTIYAEPGNHTIAMGANNNTLTLHDGNNTISASGTGNTVTAGNGNNHVSGMTGSATITLGNGNDSVVVTGANNSITVGTGTDTISAGSGGGETVVAGDGANSISGGGANNDFTTGNGASKITATGASATIQAGNGGDTVLATGTGDQITTGSGNDSITVTAGSAVIKADLASTRSNSPGRATTSINQGGNDTLTDSGTNNTIALPLAGLGLDTTNGGVLANGDIFDLRAAMAATTWDRQMSDLGPISDIGHLGLQHAGATQYVPAGARRSRSGC